MIVMKFGGTSVADAERLAAVGRLVAERRGERPVVVVSALAGVTDRLVEAAAAAEAGDAPRAETVVRELRERHTAVLTGLAATFAGAARAELARERERQDEDLAALGDRLHGIALVGECSARSRDAVLCVGELLSHRLAALALAGAGVEAAAVDPRGLVPTDAAFGEARVDRALLAERCRALVAPVVERGAVPVTGGFVGSTSTGLPATLGRGGSDLSATLLGVALDARAVEIWTDVDGMMTADPRLVPDARLLPELSFRAASELAWFGAKVLHPATIKPAVERGIPVHVRNSLRPSSPGTVIRDMDAAELPATGALHAVAWKKGIATVSVSSSDMYGVHGFLARLFAVFDRHRTSVDVVTTSETSVSMTVDRADRLEALVDELAPLGRVEVERDMALVCLVGHLLLEHPALVGSVLAALEGIPLRMFCLGSSDVNLTLVVEGARAEEVVRRLHARFLAAGR